MWRPAAFSLPIFNEVLQFFLICLFAADSAFWAYEKRGGMEVMVARIQLQFLRPEFTACVEHTWISKHPLGMPGRGIVFG